MNELGEADHRHLCHHSTDGELPDKIGYEQRDLQQVHQWLGFYE